MRQEEDKKGKTHLSRAEKQQLWIDSELSDVSFTPELINVSQHFCVNVIVVIRWRHRLNFNWLQ